MRVVTYTNNMDDLLAKIAENCEGNWKDVLLEIQEEFKLQQRRANSALRRLLNFSSKFIIYGSRVEIDDKLPRAALARRIRTLARLMKRTARAFWNLPRCELLLNEQQNNSIRQAVISCRHFALIELR